MFALGQNLGIIESHKHTDSTYQLYTFGADHVSPHI